MFRGCKMLTSVDLRSFLTIKVKNMNCMFDGCENLTVLDLSGFRNNKVKKTW
jgi:Mycoplasma protein of unknown function, DUF285.